MPSLSAPFTLSVVVPCLNEDENIVAVHAEIVAELDRYDDLEILFVDDGSTDATLNMIKTIAAGDTRVSYLSFTRNFGLEAAFSAGYRYARNDWILHLDADLQFPPAEAPKLVQAALAGHDAVFGVRVGRQDHWVRRLSSRVHDLIARRLLGIELPPHATTFRLVRAPLARRVVELRLGTPYFLATIPKLTSAWTTVPTAHRARERGTPKVGFRGLAKHAIELFVSFSSRPMTFAALTATASVLVALVGASLITSTEVGRTLLGVAIAGGLIAQAVTARFLVHVARGQPGLPMYLVREANIDIDDADLIAPAAAPLAAGRAEGSR